MGWICVIVIADFAVILSATVLNGKKGNGIAAFAIFCVLAWLQGIVVGLIPAHHGIFSCLNKTFNLCYSLSSNS